MAQTKIPTIQVTTMTATVGGGVPTPPNNTTTFLRGDATFATPAGGTTTSKSITQVAHGLAVNDVIKFAGTTYQKAKADSAANAEVIGVVTAVADVDNFTFVMEGYATGLTALTSDTTYFLSDATAGLLTATEPTATGSISKPVLKTVSATIGIINNMRGMEITATANYVTASAGKTSNVANTINFAGTDSTTMTFPTTNATIARTDAGQTFTGTQVLAENASIQLDPAGSADGKYTGITIAGTGGATIAFGDLLYLDSATSRWKLTDADSVTTSDRFIAMAVTTSTDGTAVTLLLSGQIRADAKFPALTIGSAVYVGETAGEIQVAIPTGADNVIRRVGYALTADEIYFNPSMDSQTTVA